MVYLAAFDRGVADPSGTVVDEEVVFRKRSGAEAEARGGLEVRGVAGALIGVEGRPLAAPGSEARDGTFGLSLPPCYRDARVARQISCLGPCPCP